MKVALKFLIFGAIAYTVVGVSLMYMLMLAGTTPVQGTVESIKSVFLWPFYIDQSLDSLRPRQAPAHTPAPAAKKSPARTAATHAATSTLKAIRPALSR